MPAGATIAAAGLTAAGVFGAAKVSSNASKRASELQARTGREGIDYQKGRDAIDDSRYQKRLDLYNQYVADYRARNGGATGGGGGGGAASAGVPISIADLVNGQQEAAAAQGQDAPVGSVAATVGGWNDWQRYGA